MWCFDHKTNLLPQKSRAKGCLRVTNNEMWLNLTLWRVRLNLNGGGRRGNEYRFRTWYVYFMLSRSCSRPSLLVFRYRAFGARKFYAFSNHIASLLPKRHLFHFKSTIGVFHLFKGASKYKSGWFMFWEPQNCGLTFVLCQNSSNVPETTTEEEVTGFDLESFFEWPEVDYNQIKSILNVIDWVTVFYFCVEYIVR